MSYRWVTRVRRQMELVLSDPARHTRQTVTIKTNREDGIDQRRPVVA